MMDFCKYNPAEGYLLSLDLCEATETHESHKLG